jgi:hypothetical protein
MAAAWHLLLCFGWVCNMLYMQALMVYIIVFAFPTQQGPSGAGKTTLLENIAFRRR